MGRKANVARGSLAAIFIAGGGAAIPAQAGALANPQSNVNAQVASYFGPLGLEPSFQQYLKATSGFQNFDKWYKFNKEDAILGVQNFSNQNEVPPPPEFQTQPDA
jgi:hypothetical protein